MWAVMTVVVVLEFTAGKLTHIGRQKYIYIKLLVTLIYSSIVEC